jgi:hypothetical protein
MSFLKRVQFNCYFSCHSPIHLFPFYGIYSRVGFYYFLLLCLMGVCWYKRSENLAEERKKKRSVAAYIYYRIVRIIV